MVNIKTGLMVNMRCADDDGDADSDVDVDADADGEDGDRRVAK